MPILPQAMHRATPLSCPGSKQQIPLDDGQVSAVQCAREAAGDQGWAMWRVGQLLCPVLPSTWCAAYSLTIAFVLCF